MNNQKIKVLITGSTGLLGRALVKIFQKSGFHVLATGYSRATPPIIKLDLTDEEAVSTLLYSTKPDIIIHAAAERKPDICENNQTQTLSINLNATSHLATLAKKINARFFFISTDYVFNGNQAPYDENSDTEPLNFYGKTKEQAEKAILAISEQHTIIRVPVLYGDVLTLNESAITTIAQQIINEDSSTHDNWAIRYPTHVEDIALTLCDLSNLPAKQTSGIFHISNHQPMTKFDIAQCVINMPELNQKFIVADDNPSQDASRPYNCALKNTRLSTLGICHQRDFKEAFIKILKIYVN